MWCVKGLRKKHSRPSNHFGPSDMFWTTFPLDVYWNRAPLNPLLNHKLDVQEKCRKIWISSANPQPASKISEPAQGIWASMVLFQQICVFNLWKRFSASCRPLCDTLGLKVWFGAVLSGRKKSRRDVVKDLLTKIEESMCEARCVCTENREPKAEQKNASCLAPVQKPPDNLTPLIQAATSARVEATAYTKSRNSVQIWLGQNVAQPWPSVYPCSRTSKRMAFLLQKWQTPTIAEKFLLKIRTI